MAFLILFGRGRISDPLWSHALIVGYVLSNIFLTFLPTRLFYHSKFFHALVFFDTGIISCGMYVSEKMATDFYLVFFLLVILVSLSRNFKLLMAIGGMITILYGILLHSWGLLLSERAGSYILRVPFIFVMTVFYGYIIQSLTKESREKLMISEDKYRGLFENGNDGVIILRAPQLQIADVNKKVEAATHYAKGELLGREISVLFRPEDQSKITAHFGEVQVHGEARTDSLSILGRDGVSMEVDLSTKRIDLGDESFYQMIFRDLTEQRKLEKKIREAKRNLEAIFDGIQDFISIQSADYTILRLNRSVAKKHNATFNELIGRKCYEAYYQRTLPCEGCPVSVTIQTRQPSSSTMSLQEGDVTLRLFSYPILDEKGELTSAIEYVRDITEEQRLQQQLIQSEKLAGIGILASGMAHEIHNPLSGIIGMAELALEEEDPRENKGYLTDILNCAHRIAEIVNGLRSYSRLAKKEEQGLIDVNEVLEESLRMVQFVFKKHSAEVIKALEPVEKIEASAGEIQQVFTNLITNAFQALDGKGGKVILSTRSGKDTVEIQVRDTGKGIPARSLNKIFDPFFTTKSPGEGTGLGLNIVYRIVTKYEGTIDVESREGVGTTFTIKFPLPVRRSEPCEKRY